MATVIIEISRPFQRRPGRFHSEVETRYWFGWFAIGFLKMEWSEFIRQYTNLDWINT